MQAPQQSQPDMQQAAEQREHESGGTISGVQGLHTKDGEEETVQPAGNRQSSYAEVWYFCLWAHVISQFWLAKTI